MTLAEFASSGLALVVYRERQVVFESREPGLAPLLGYLGRERPADGEIVVFDKVVGAAAALLLLVARARVVHTPTIARPAFATLTRAGVECHYRKQVAGILNRAGTGPCPMEVFARGKSPEEFYEAMRKRSAADREQSNGGARTRSVRSGR